MNIDVIFILKFLQLLNYFSVISVRFNRATGLNRITLLKSPQAINKSINILMNVLLRFEQFINNVFKIFGVTI